MQSQFWMGRSLHLLVRSLSCIFLLVMALPGCNSVGMTPSATPQTSQTPFNTAQPTLTPNPTPQALYPMLGVSLVHPGQWPLSMVYRDETLPDWIIADRDQYKLDPDFEVQQIALSYQWWGLADPVLNYQQIKLSGGAYLLDEKTSVPVGKIKAFLDSIVRLEPVPQTLSSITHTDDYPGWDIELTGTDGTHILLSSDSNGRAYAPWNVIYNGQIYAQFDGSIAPALDDLFSVTEGEPMASFSPGGQELGKISVESGGWPNQLTFGFSGLLPVNDGFNYWPDPEKGELVGRLIGRSSIGGMGHMIIGSVTQLESITVELPDKKTIHCKTEALESDDPTATSWSFVCPVENPGVSGRYRYPIRVVFGTDKGEKAKVDGELFGEWKDDIVLPLSSFPRKVAEILDDHQPFQNMAQKHQVLLLDFGGTTDPSIGTLEESAYGKIVFLGETVLDGRTLRYSLTSSFSIVDSQLLSFDVDESKLQALLDDTLQNPLARKQLDGLENPVLNLYYFQGHKVELANGKTTFSGSYSTRVSKCQGLPSRESVPTENTPLRAFNIDSRWIPRPDPTVLWLDGTVRILDFFTDTSAQAGDPFSALLPKEMLTPGKAALGINVVETWGNFIYFSWPPDSTQEDIDAYTVTINQLPGKKEYHSWGITVKDSVFISQADGSLSLVECKPVKE